MTDHDPLEPYLDEFGKRLAEAAGAGGRRKLFVGRGWRRVAAVLRRPVTKRGLAIGVATLVASGSAMAATVRLVTEGSGSPKVVRVVLSPPNYGGCGDAHFASQADAQAVLKADPRDPYRLDSDRNGIACPGLPPPRDLKPLASVVARLTCRSTDQRSARCPKSSQPFDPETNLRFQIDEFDCKDYASQADAQAVLRFQPSDPNDLDGDGDGIACPGDPGPKDLKRVVRPPS